MLALVVSILWSAPLAAQSGLTYVNLDPGADACANRNDDVRGYWVNPFDREVRIKRLRFWQAADYPLQGDLGANLYLVTEDGASQLLASLPFDRYAIPSNDRPTDISVSPDWIAVPAGAYLSLHRYCYTWMGPGYFHHQALGFWYTTESR